MSQSDPELAEAVEALERAGIAAEVYDAHWRVAHITSEYMTVVSSGRRGVAPSGLREHWLSPAMTEIREAWPAGPTFESFLELVRDWGGYVVATTPGGLDAVLELADPRFEQALKEAVPRTPPLGIDLAGFAYAPLAELASASARAVRDAPAIPVCRL